MTVRELLEQLVEHTNLDENIGVQRILPDKNIEDIDSKVTEIYDIKSLDWSAIPGQWLLVLDD